MRELMWRFSNAGGGRSACGSGNRETRVRPVGPDPAESVRLGDDEVDWDFNRGQVAVGRDFQFAGGDGAAEAPLGADGYTFGAAFARVAAAFTGEHGAVGFHQLHGSDAHQAFVAAHGHGGDVYVRNRGVA